MDRLGMKLGGEKARRISVKNFSFFQQEPTSTLSLTIFMSNPLKINTVSYIRFSKKRVGGFEMGGGIQIPNSRLGVEILRRTKLTFDSFEPRHPAPAIPILTSTHGKVLLKEIT